jgi:carboxyl-terminal processing protease
VSPSRSWLLFAVTLALLLGATALLVSTALRRLEGAAAESVPGESLYREVMARAGRDHVDPVDAERAVYGAMKGLVSELDPHSRVFDPAEWAEFERESRGETTGIGIEVVEIGSELIVVETVAGSPAAEAGIRPGERVVAVAGRAAGKDRAAVLAALEGPRGSPLELVLAGPDPGSPERRVTVEHDTFDVPTVAVRTLPEGVGYVRISAFRPRTPDAFERAVRVLVHSSRKGLVLDLRFNRGGSFDAAVTVADLWLAKGTVVRTRSPRDDQSRAATPDAPLLQVPTIVLVNGSTASAAEVVAGALQDTQSALLVGERTFGKGVVQELIEFESWPGGMKLTTARTFSPAGRCIDRGLGRTPGAAGLLPDFVVPVAESEAALLETELGRGSWPAEIRARLAEAEGAGAPPDRQLDAAIALLRGSPADVVVSAPLARPSGSPR